MFRVSTTGWFEVTEGDKDWPAFGEVRLKSVGGSIPKQFQGAFTFNFFNLIQSSVFQDVFKTGKSLVVR